MPKLLADPAEPQPNLSSAALRYVIGRRIRQLRRQKNITQGQLAHRAHIAANTLRSLEKGQKRTQYAKLVRVTRALGTSVGVLMHAIEGEPDLWANPLLRNLLAEDLQIAQQYHHASSAVRAIVRRVLTHPDRLRGVRSRFFHEGYAALTPKLQENVDILIEHLHTFVAMEAADQRTHHLA